MAQPLAFIHKSDPKQELWDKASKIAGNLKPLSARVLVAVYQPTSETTKGGIIVPEKVKGEYAYQGKVGLVLSMGPIAFTDDATHRWGDAVPKVGDWVVYNIGDTRAADADKTRIRFVEDADILAITDDPDAVW